MYVSPRIQVTSCRVRNRSINVPNHTSRPPIPYLTSHTKHWGFWRPSFEDLHKTIVLQAAPKFSETKNTKNLYPFKDSNFGWYDINSGTLSTHFFKGTRSIITVLAPFYELLAFSRENSVYGDFLGTCKPSASMHISLFKSLE